MLPLHHASWQKEGEQALFQDCPPPPSLPEKLPSPTQPWFSSASMDRLDSAKKISHQQLIQVWPCCVFSLTLTNIHEFVTAAPVDMRKRETMGEIKHVEGFVSLRETLVLQRTQKPPFLWFLLLDQYRLFFTADIFARNSRINTGVPNHTN